MRLREEVKQHKAELVAERELRQQMEVELAREGSMKDNAARALLEVEKLKADLSNAYGFAVEKNKELSADKDELTANVITLEARLKREMERAEEAEAHLHSRPSEDAAIRKFKASAEFQEAVKEAAVHDVVVAASEIVRLKEEVVVAAKENARLEETIAAYAAEVSFLKRADAEAAAKIMKLGAKLEKARGELGAAKESRKNRRAKRAQKKGLVVLSQGSLADQSVDASGTAGGGDASGTAGGGDASGTAGGGVSGGIPGIVGGTAVAGGGSLVAGGSEALGVLVAAYGGEDDEEDAAKTPGGTP